jgi:hypothetical protein
MAAAGLLFAIITLVWSYLGYLVGSGAGWKRQAELGASALLIAMFTGLVFGMVYSPRFWIFALLEAGSSYYFARRRRRQQQSATPAAQGVVHPHFLYVILFGYPLIAASVFAFWLYPVLPRGIGGARPRPINVTWANSELATKFLGKRLYSVFDDGAIVYLGSEKPTLAYWLEQYLPSESWLDSSRERGR